MFEIPRFIQVVSNRIFCCSGQRWQFDTSLSAWIMTYAFPALTVSHLSRLVHECETHPVAVQLDLGNRVSEHSHRCNVLAHFGERWMIWQNLPSHIGHLFCEIVRDLLQLCDTASRFILLLSKVDSEAVFL